MNIRELAAEQENYIIQTRRHLHQHPELGTKEYKTTQYIVDELTKMGIEVETFSDITGCVGTLKGKKTGKTLLLRADIDALPINEENNCEYASKTPGVMHACGHDAHAAMLLGAAKILTAIKDELCGTVKFLFQMAEELGRESERYVERGCLDGVDAAFGMHVWSLLDSNTANFEVGERMACSDRFTITVKGEATHGSTPHLGNDAMVAAAGIVMALQSIVSRQNNAADSLVISVGKMNGGQRLNIIADHVELVGTCRAFNRELRNSLPQRIEKIATLVAQTYNCTAECDYYFGPDPLINEDPQLVAIAQQAAKTHLGENCLAPLSKMTGAEDFSVFLSKVPGVYGYIGARNVEKGINCTHHHPLFDIDEAILEKGSAIYAEFAKEYCK